MFWRGFLADQTLVRVVFQIARIGRVFAPLRSEIGGVFVPPHSDVESKLFCPDVAGIAGQTTVVSAEV